MKTILEKFCLNPITYDRYCIEQRLPDRSKNIHLFPSFFLLLVLEILILDHCNVFYALVRSSDGGEIDLIVREKTRQEREIKSTCPIIGAGHNRTPSGLSISSTQSR